MKRILKSFGFAAASLASTAYSLATFDPIPNGPSYQVGIPSSSSISSSSTGNIYLQLSAPKTYQWVGLGIGQQMAGATIFVMYADGNGNVTISARDGNQGHVQPLLNTKLQSSVTLLEGSGIVGDKMIANVLCTACPLLSDKTNSASPFISAWMPGSALDSTSPSATINQHGLDSYAQFTFDLSAAVLSSDANPFVSSGTSGSSASGTSASSPASTSQSGGSKGGNGNNASSGQSSSKVTETSASDLANYRKAHGIIMGVTVVLLFPIGAMFMRLGGGAWAHGGLQIFSLCALIAGFGIGIKLGQMTSYLYNTTHTIFGTVIVCLFLIQPFLGIVHHLQYAKSGTRNPVSHIHIWFGRIILVLGIINGGLGLKLAANSKNGEIAYGVVAGVVGLAYVVLVIFKRKGTTNIDGARRGRWGSKGNVGDTSP